MEQVSLILLILANASPSVAKPINPAGWITSYDYPYNRTGEKEGLTRFRLRVSREGKVENCEIVQSSGFTELDDLTCALMTKRGHFHPALDQDGKPILSFFRNQAVWKMPDHSMTGPPVQPDLTLQVNQLPSKFSNPTYILIPIVVGTDGKIEYCGSQDKKYQPVLKELACKQTMLSWQSNIWKNADSVPQRYLTSWLVEFQTSEIR